MCVDVIHPVVLGAQDRTHGDGHGDAEPGTSAGIIAAAAPRHFQGSPNAIVRPTSTAGDSLLG